MSDSEPFWEEAYRDLDAETFGPPADEIVGLADMLPEDARVLDIGCGDGRNALYMAERGFEVDAFDVSLAGIDKLRSRCRARDASVAAWVQDAGRFAFRHEYDLVVLHGVLHLLDRQVWRRLLEAVRKNTKVCGWNVAVVFTNRLPPPPDLAPRVRGLFEEGELREQYQDWLVTRWEAYTLEDEHPGGVRHRHPVNKIVAQKPDPQG